MKALVRTLSFAGILAVSAHAALPAAAAGGPSQESDAAIALLLHIEGSPQPQLAASVAELRQASLEDLATLIRDAGFAVAERGPTEALVVRHRVRAAGALSAEFLADVRGELGSPTLLSVTLLVDSGGFTVMTRSIDTSGGRLFGIGLADAVIASEAWRLSLSEVLRRSMPVLSGRRDPCAALLVLPGLSVGVDSPTARAATACVLGAACADGRWAVLDPALVVAVVTSEGHDIAVLDARGRTLVAERFGVEQVVVVDIISFGFVTAASTLTVPDDGAVPVRRGTLPEFTFTLRLVDLRTGLVKSATAFHAPEKAGTGWFGSISVKTLLGQLNEGAAELWLQFDKILEEAAT